MNYIGIKGHRGSGKKTIAYLLGNTIEYILQNKPEELFEENFSQWCTHIKENENIINKCELQYVYFDSFSDALRVFIKMILGCETRWLYDDYKKDHVVICFNDFTFKEYDIIPQDININTAEEIYDIVKNSTISGEPCNFAESQNKLYMTLREFIMYFGYYIMQMGLGMNVWIKTYKASQTIFTNIFDGESDWKIFSDVKSVSEVRYLREMNGVIIDVERPGHKKKDTLLSLKELGKGDYKVKIRENLEDLSKDILSIAKIIISHQKGE